LKLCLELGGGVIKERGGGGKSKFDIFNTL
jgi:hypothetical protein